MEKSIPKTLLVVKNRAMGDAIMGLSTLQYLKSLYPEMTIYYAVPQWIAPLLSGYQDVAERIIPLNLRTMGDWIKTYQQLKGLKIDAVLELFQSGRGAKFFGLWEIAFGPKYYFHNHHNKIGDVFDQGVIKSNIQRDLDGAWSFFGKGERPPSYLDFPPKMKVPSNKKEQIVLGVVATRETKMWPLEYYIELTHLIFKRFPHKKVIIPLGPGDKKIEVALKNKVSISSEIIYEPLENLPKVLAGSSQYIGNDTGLKHICVALGVPTFTLFGPEPPTEWHPYDRNSHPLYFKEPLECRTRTAHYCGLNTCESMICLNTFKPTDLMEQISFK